MIPILKKELNAFFASPIAYLVLAIFLILNGLFLWVFREDFNILNAGFADLNSFFYLTPWVFLFLIPAITMRSFADEFNNGTIEILKTRPITNWQIVLGKFTAAWLLVIIAILPTITYVYTIYKLGNPIGNLDIGSTIGSYLGVVLLAAAYAAVGLFTSTLSKNQIIAFILGVFILLTLFWGVTAIASLFNNQYIAQLSMQEHFKSISRGVIDTRDILYFGSIITFFLFITKLQLDE